jgi:hypothetical protein
MRAEANKPDGRLNDGEVRADAHSSVEPLAAVLRTARHAIRAGVSMSTVSKEASAMAAATCTIASLQKMHCGRSHLQISSSYRLLFSLHGTTTTLRQVPLDATAEHAQPFPKNFDLVAFPLKRTPSAQAQLAGATCTSCAETGSRRSCHRARVHRGPPYGPVVTA